MIIDAIVHYISVTSGELYLSPPLPIPELHQWEGGNIIHARAETGGGRQSEPPLSDQPSPRSQQWSFKQRTTRRFVNTRMPLLGLLLWLKAKQAPKHGK